MASTTGTKKSVESVELEAKSQASAAVLAYRAIEWEAVERGEAAAVTALVAACDLHDATRRFLEDGAGDLGRKLAEGLERFFTAEVGPRLGRPDVLRQLRAVPPPATATEEPTEEGLAPRKRPTVTVGHTVRMNTGCGNLYVTINETENGEPFELFNHMGKAGGCAASQNEAIGRLISYALRCGASIDPLIKQLKGISCHRPAWGEDGKVSSCSDAIGKALEKYYTARERRVAREAAATNGARGGSASTDAPEPADVLSTRREVVRGDVSFESRANGGAGSGGAGSSDIHRVQGACVDCGSQLAFEEGCVKCHSCGFTECG